MTAIDLMPPPPAVLPRHTAARALAACVAEFDYLKSFEGQTLTFDTDPAKVARMDELRAAWARWADDAEEVFGRVKGDPSLAADERRRFEADIRHARYLATVDVGEMRRRRDRAEAGHVLTREEVRRELGLQRRR